jgi:membrane fusion protein, heavy metal efflux system
MTPRTRCLGARRSSAFIALVAVAAGGGCSRARNEAPESEAASPPSGVVHFSAAQVQHGGVRWSPVTTESVVPVLELPGQLVPDEDHSARLAAPVEGRVMAVHVRVGDRVRRGQALVVLQSAGGSAARADLVKGAAEVASRRSALAYARTARERAERLLDAKAGSPQDVERARADEDLAQSAFGAAQAERTRAEGVARQLGISGPSDDVVVRSPLDGVVIARDALPGSVATPGGALVTVADVSRLWLEVAAPDRAAQTLRAGARVRFTTGALPGQTFEARIDSVGGGLDAQTRTLPVRASVANTSGLLRPNMFATVFVEAGSETTALRVPDAAVVLVDEQPAVFVAAPEPDGGARFERRRVELGRKEGGRTLVTGGIRAGENVVTEGAFAIKSQLERSKMPSEG